MKHPKAHGFLPDYFADNIRDIDFTALKARGVRCLVLDVDHTLVSYGSLELEAETLAFLNQVHAKKLVEKIFLASNSRRNLAPMAQQINAESIRAPRLLRKPSKRYFKNVLAKIGYQPQQVVMVGDKLINDVYGANRVGMVTVLVKPIGPDAWFDRLLLRRVIGRGFLRYKRAKND